MKAIEIRSPGAPEVLQVCERAKPIAGLGEVLIRVHASGVNRPDVLQRLGLYPVPEGVTDIPGLELSGVIEEGDSLAMAQAGFKTGDRVCALVAGGAYAQWCVAPVVQCLPVPDGLSEVEAASLPETFFTVWSNLVDRGHLRSGETLLIQGGSSGIGVTAIQIAKALGAQVIVTAGTDAKCAACLALGADHAVNYKLQDYAEVVRNVTHGRGVDVVLDMVAGDYVAREIECLAEEGRLIIIAVQGGVKSEINSGLILRRRLTLTGSTLRPRSAAFKGAIAKSLLQHVWPWLENGRVKPVVSAVFAAERAADAHRWMESGQNIGKIVLTWN